MTADERIDTASRLLRLMIDDCPNCRGSGTVLQFSIQGTREVPCGVCFSIREVEKVLAQKGPESG